jgi:hypothetical protein
MSDVASMTSDPERSARILESHVVGDGGSSDTAFCGLALEVRTMGSDRSAIGKWVKDHGALRGVDSNTLKAIVDAIVAGAEAG